MAAEDGRHALRPAPACAPRVGGGLALPDLLRRSRQLPQVPLRPRHGVGGEAELHGHLPRPRLLAGDEDDGEVRRDRRTDRDVARPVSRPARRAGASVRKLDPRRADPADDDRARRRRRDLASDLRVRHRHRQPTLLASRARHPGRARPLQRGVLRSRRARHVGVDTAPLPDHPRGPPLAAAGSARGGAGRRRDAVCRRSSTTPCRCSCRCSSSR